MKRITFRQAIFLVLFAQLLLLLGSGVFVYLSQLRANRMDDAYLRLDSTTAVTAATLNDWASEGIRAVMGIQHLHFLPVDLPGDLTLAQIAQMPGVEAYLREYANLQPAIKSLSLLDYDSGRVLLSTEPAYVNQDHSQAEHFREGRESIFVSPLQRQLAGEDLVFVISAPIHNHPGRDIAVVVAELDTLGIGQLHPSLVTDTGLPLHTAAYAGAFSVAMTPRTGASYLGLQPPSTGALQALGPEILAAIQAEQFRAMSATLADGEEVLVVVRPLPSLEASVVAWIDHNAAMASLEPINRLVLSIGISLIAVAALLSYLLTIWLVAPLNKIVASVRRLEAGELAHRMVVARRDEFGQLARAFNEMAASLETAYTRLEEQVAARTAELSQQNRQLQSEIQERQRAEQALSQRESAYRDLFEHAPIALWQEDFSEVKRRIEELQAEGVTDLAAYCAAHPEEVADLWSQIRILNINQACLHLLRATSKDQLMAGLRPLESAAEHRNFLAELEALAEGRTHLTLSSATTRLDGSTAHVVIHWSISPGHEADASNVLVAIHDITELYEASDLIRLQSAALNSAANAILISDRAGVIQWVNPAFTQLTGFSLAEAVGQTPQLLRSGRHPKEFYAQLWETVTAGKVWRGIIQNRHKDGRIYLEDQTITPVHDAEGQISHFVAIKQDVTDQVRIQESLKRQVAELRILQTVAILGTQVPDEDIIIRQATQVIGDTFYPDHFGVMLLDASGQFLTPHASYRGIDQATLGWQVPIHQGVAGHVVRTRQPLRLGDVTTDPRFLGVTPASRSELCVPLMAGEQVLGVINAESRQSDAFGPEDERLLATIAGQLALAMERARLFSEAQQRNQELTSLHDLALSIGGILKADDLLAYLALRLQELIAPDALFFALYDEVSQVLRVALAWEEGETLDELQQAEIPLEQGGLTSWVIQNRTPLLIKDLASNTAPVAPRHVTRPARSWLGVPLVVRGQIIGAVSVQSFQPNRFHLGHQRFMESLASQAAIGIENATLFDEIQRLLDHAQAQAQQVQQIINTVPDGVLLLDGEYGVVLANPTAQAHLALLTGQAQPQVISALGGLPMGDLLPPLGWEQSRHREIVLPGPHVRIFEMDARPIQPIPSRSGWVVTLREITQEREQQNYLHAQERLATVGQLAAGIAHDFNNIMGAIVLYAQMLARQADLSPKHQEYIRTIREQAHHATNLIRQILDFSRHAMIERQPLEISPFMVNLVKLLGRTLPENIEVILQDQGQDPPLQVMADATRLQQTMMNLAVNARDAMPRGGLLTFRVAPVDMAAGQAAPFPDMPPGDWVQIQVQDNGEGITPQAQAHIFEPFFSTKPRDKGTGLGLAQVYGIVKQHNGFIGVESRLGEGTSFTIYLPAMPKNSTEAYSLYLDDDQLWGGKGTILVVEDNDVARLALKDVLDGLGYGVLTAANGEEALALYIERQAEIDLVLSDMVMPKLGGTELFQALVKHDPGVKLIIMTGYPLKDGGAELLELGILDWLPKPFGAEDLARRLAGALGRG